MQRAAALMITLLATAFALLESPGSYAADAEYSPWWGTDCEYFHPEDLSNGAMNSHGFVTFRKFPVTAKSIDESSRVLSPFDHGISFKMNGGRFTASWRDAPTPPLVNGKAHMRFRVTPLGQYNSAIALTVLIDGEEVGGGAFGNMELNCWRPLEDLIEKYLPGSIEGSPPRPHFPLHDMNGNVVPESAEQNNALVGTGVTPRFAIVGKWVLVFPPMSCRDEYDFMPDHRRASVSGEERLTANYEIVAEPRPVTADTPQFYRWTDRVVESNNRPDCNGNKTPVGQTVVNYIYVEAPNRIGICEHPSLKKCIGLFEKVGHDDS